MMTLQEKEEEIIRLTKEVKEEKLAKDLNLTEGNYYSMYCKTKYARGWFKELTKPLSEREINQCLRGDRYWKMDKLNKDGYTFAGEYCGGSWVEPTIVMYSEEKLIEYLPDIFASEFSEQRERTLKYDIKRAEEQLEEFYANKKDVAEQMEKFLKGRK